VVSKPILYYGRIRPDTCSSILIVFDALQQVADVGKEKWHRWCIGDRDDNSNSSA